MASGSVAATRSLPHMPGRVPVLGDVTSVDRRRPTQHEMRLARRLGPVFERKILGSRLTVVASAQLAGQCVDERVWGRGLAGPGVLLRRIVPDGLFTVRSSDPVWGQARRILTPGFTQAVMHRYHDTMHTVADDLMSEWAGGGVVDVHSSMTRATLETIGRAGFSRDLGLLGKGGQDAGSREFVAAIARILRWAAESTNDLPVLGAARRGARAWQVRRDTGRIRGYVDEIIAERCACPTGESDLLNLMLTTSDPETGQRLSPETVRNQVLTFLIAGHETTAALLEVALYYLAADPDLQQRVREEIGARERIEYPQVARLRLVRRVLDECLRLWPPAPGFFRVARSEQHLGGYRIPQGRAVFVLSLAAQRDPQAWGPAAEQFDPDRFDPQRGRCYPDRFFRPFGVGPRVCIGRAFALHEATLLIARILADFTLIGDGAPIDMVERGTLRPVPYQLTVIPR